MVRVIAALAASVLLSTGCGNKNNAQGGADSTSTDSTSLAAAQGSMEGDGENFGQGDGAEGDSVVAKPKRERAVNVNASRATRGDLVRPVVAEGYIRARHAAEINAEVVDWRLPKEGAPLWYDSFAIPKSAKNVAEAHEFLNNLLDPKVVAPISDFLGYPNPNKDAMSLVATEIRDNPGLTPTAEAQKTLYVLQPLPQKVERVRTRAWTTIKSGT
jgi:ABC-type Fe3+ transport system substrate-binding protein